MNSKLYEYFKELKFNNKIGHAYLIGNVEYDNLKTTLENVFLDCFFAGKQKIDENPDVFVIKPEKNIIKKESIVELHNFLNNTSQLSGKKIYIIEKCELMNLSSANSLLKILEEPMDNIYAFLLSSNMNNVLETIKSRCQNVFISSSVLSSISLEESQLVEKAYNCIDIFEKKKINALPYIYQEIGKKVDKQEFINLLKLIENIYKEILDLKVKKDMYVCNFNQEFIDKYIKEITSDRLINILILLNNVIESLNYNLNISLVIDKLVIDLGRC